MTRDMTRAAFVAACERYGFRKQGVLGYYALAPPCEGVRVSVYNAGSRRRDQLAYLIQEQVKAEKRHAVKRVEKAGPKLLAALKGMLAENPDDCYCTAVFGETGDEDAQCPPCVARAAVAEAEGPD